MYNDNFPYKRFNITLDFLQKHIEKTYPVNIETGKRSMESFKFEEPLSLIDVSAFGGHLDMILERMSRRGLAVEIGVMEKVKGQPKDKFKSYGWVLTSEFFNTVEKLEENRPDPLEYKNRAMQRKIKAQLTSGDKGYLKQKDFRSTAGKNVFQKLANIERQRGFARRNHRSICDRPV